MRLAPVLICLGLVSMAIAHVGSTLNWSGVVEISDVWLEDPGATAIHARLYVPVPPPRHPGPALLLAHGYMGNLAMLEPMLARPLAASGFVVLSIDRRGYGRSGGSLWAPPASSQSLEESDPELRVGIGYLRAQPSVDPERIGLVGHSDGARAAILTACADWSITATVAISANLRPVEWMNPVVPKNLLLVYGADELYISQLDRELLLKRATADATVRRGERYGSFEAEDARQAIELPGAGHLTALFTPELTSRTLSWLSGALRVPEIRSHPPAHPLLLLVVGMAGVLCVVIGVAIVLHRVAAVSPAGAAPRRGHGLAHVLAAPLFVAAFAAAPRLAPLLSPSLAWLPLESASWFVALVWAIAGSLTLLLALAVLALRWADRALPFPRSRRGPVLRGVLIGTCLGTVTLVCAGAALVGWYETLVSNEKLLALPIYLLVLFPAAAIIDVWLTWTVAVYSPDRARGSGGVAAGLLGAASLAFLLIGPGAVPGYAYISFFAVSAALGAASLVAPWMSGCRLGTAAYFTALISWVCVIACPLY